MFLLLVVMGSQGGGSLRLRSCIDDLLGSTFPPVIRPNIEVWFR